MRLILLVLVAWSAGARAADCGFELTARFRAHAAARANAKTHTLVSALAQVHPLVASAGNLLRWNVVTNVPARPPGGAAEAFRRFIAGAGHRVEVVRAANARQALRDARAITSNPRVESEKIWVIVDFTGVPVGSYLAPRFEAMWKELDRRHEAFLPEDEDAPRAWLLPIALIPDEMEKLPRLDTNRFEIRRPNVQRIFGFHMLDKFL